MSLVSFVSSKQERERKRDDKMISYAENIINELTISRLKERETTNNMLLSNNNNNKNNGK